MYVFIYLFIIDKIKNKENLSKVEKALEETQQKLQKEREHNQSLTIVYIKNFNKILLINTLIINNTYIGIFL